MGVAGHAAKDILHQVGGVGVLQAAVAGEPVNDRPVELDELVPRVGVAAVPDAGEQSDPREGRLGHAGVPSE